jgi:anti-sigma B factor antagonist
MSSDVSRLTIDTRGERALTLHGTIDSHTAGILDARISELGLVGDIHLDLSGIQFIDSSGLRSIVAAHRDLADREHRLVLTGISDPVHRLLEITGLEGHLDFG